MTRHHKVLWYEGMTLDPHHFQQWDRYHQDMLNSRVHAISRFNWGVSELAIDEDSLLNGQFNLLRCKGVTTDGLHFDIPPTDPIPNSRNIQENFPATEEALEVFLAIPVEHHGGKNYLIDKTREK